jgi:hypothetical protein
MNMADTTTLYHVEGVDWKLEVSIDGSIFETDRDQLIEAASQALEARLKSEDKLNLGPLLIVKKDKSKKEAMVNSFICLNNVGEFELAQDLRNNFLSGSGQDLALDDIGVSYT